MQCKITVLKKIYNQDLVDKYYLEKDYPGCEIFAEGQEFVYEEDELLRKPDGFCGWAWDDIQRTLYDVMVIKKEKSAVVSCTDGIRPVIFRVERIE